MSNEYLDAVYSERNTLAIGLAKYVLLMGGKAGWGTDTNSEWDPTWRCVVYIELPTGAQVSFHMSPLEAPLATQELPKYEGKWDGTYLGKGKEWLKEIK